MGRGVIFLGILLVGLRAWADPMRAGLARTSDPLGEIHLTQGGPDAYGYRFIDNINETAGPVYSSVYQDISSTGTALGISGDEQATTFSCPILIRFYGQNWGTPPSGSSATVVSANIGVNTNAYIRLLGAGQANPPDPYTGVSLPTSDASITPGGFISPFLYDGNMNGANDSAQWQVVGTAPSRRLIIQWTNWGYFGGGGATDMTIQIQISESSGSSDSEIHFIYVGSTDAVEGGNGALIGIQAAGGTSSLQYSLNTPNSTTPNSSGDPRVIKFFAGDPPDPPTNLIQSGTSNGAAGPIGFVSDATAYFRATVTDPDAGDLVGIEVEILPANLTFQSTVTGQTARTAPANLVSNGSVAEASYLFDGNPFGSGDYQWRVRSIDSGGNESAWVTFSQTPIQVRVDLSPPPTPQPVSPLPGQATVGGDVRFVWQPVADVGPAGLDFYEIEASLSAGFAVLQGTDSFTATQGTLFLPTSDLPYYWRVRAVDNGGNASAWSAPIQFFTKLDDGINHGGGDCATSAGTQPGTILSILVGMLSLSAAWVTRRRRARTG